METSVRPLSEITHRAITVLAREIGSADTVRFVNQLSGGYGNYTEEREAPFADPKLDEIVEPVRKGRNRSGEAAA